MQKRPVGRLKKFDRYREWEKNRYRCSVTSYMNLKGERFFFASLSDRYPVQFDRGFTLVNIFMHPLVHTFDSKILRRELSFQQQLGKWLPKTGNWIICWQATKHGIKSNIFHNLCDGKIPTLTIVKVAKSDKMLIFGGYANATWGGEGKLGYIKSTLWPFWPRFLDTKCFECY